MQRATTSGGSGSEANEQLLGEHHVAAEAAADVCDIRDLLVEEGSELTASQTSIKEGVKLKAVEDGDSPGTIILKMPQPKPRAEKKSGRSQYICGYPECRKTFLSYYSLKSHDNAHSGVRPHVCQWSGCSRTFTSLYSLSAHLRTHTGERPYSCTAPGCQKAFKSSSDLGRHSRTHTGDKPYACTFRGCFKTFSTLDIRKVHLRTHTGERPYVCDYQNCRKSFSSQTNLTNHTRTHTGEKPFKCKHPGCEKSFTEYSTMHKHQMVHVQSVITCDECKRRFRSMSKFQAHRVREHGWVVDELAETQTEETVQPSTGAESPQRIQFLLTELDVRTLQIDGETAQVLVLPADGDPVQESNGSSDLHLLGCTGALVVEGGVSPDLVVSSTEMSVEDPEPGDVGLSVVVEDQGT